MWWRISVTKKKKLKKKENARDLVELGEGKWRLARRGEKGTSSFQLFRQQIDLERYPVWKQLLCFAIILIFQCCFPSEHVQPESVPQIPVLEEFPLSGKSVMVYGKVPEKESIKVKVIELGGFLTNKLTEHTIVISEIASLVTDNPSKVVKKILKSAVSSKQSP
jgi:hypothetical protein